MSLERVADATICNSFITRKKPTNSTNLCLAGTCMTRRQKQMLLKWPHGRSGIVKKVQITRNVCYYNNYTNFIHHSVQTDKLQKRSTSRFRGPLQTSTCCGNFVSQVVQFCKRCRYANRVSEPGSNIIVIYGMFGALCREIQKVVSNAFIYISKLSTRASICNHICCRRWVGRVSNLRSK